MSEIIPRTSSTPAAGAGRHALAPRVILGLFIAAAGVLLLIDRLGLAPTAAIVRQGWPVALIVMGAVIVWQERRGADRGVRGRGMNGMILLAVGVWLLLNTLGVTSVQVWDLFWPAVLIVLGVLLVTHTRRRPASLSSDDRISVIAVLGGVKRTADTRQFRGGEITAFMGGCNLDLRQATIPPGEDAVIDVMALMAGCELAVPSGWVVVTQVVPVMGGIDDKRLPPLAAPAGGPAAPRLVLRGFVMMGGIEIKS